MCAPQDANYPSTAVVLSAGTIPQYRMIVNNTGNATLTNVRVTDPMFPSLSGNLGTLVPGASKTVSVTGTWAAGTITNKATVVGTSGTTTVTDHDPAVYNGTYPLVPGIDIRKQVKDIARIYQVCEQMCGWVSSPGSEQLWRPHSVQHHHPQHW